MKEQTDVKSSNSLKASPATRVKNSLSVVGKRKIYRCLIIDIIPCVMVTGLETDAFVDIRCPYRHADGASAQSTQGAVAILRDKTVQGCVSQNSDPMSSILRKARELGLNARHYTP